MDESLIHDRGRGPEIVGTRITVYHLLPYFLDPSATEAYICLVTQLTPEQVGAARAYVLNHADTVLAEHLKIEARIAAGNPPSVAEKARKTHETFVRFRFSQITTASREVRNHWSRTSTSPPIGESVQVNGSVPTGSDCPPRYVAY